MGSPDTVFTDISVSIAQIKKNKKNKVHLFQILLLGGPSQLSQLVPNPLNWSPSTVFFTDISVSVAQIKKNKNTRCIFFSNSKSTGPQPIQLVPRHRFYR